ncbi:MAG: transposase [Chitinophagaceae bacterium]|nr:transposase [Chitinophagaceae bacterium]
MRRELLNAYIFTTMREVREHCEKWRQDYNTEGRTNPYNINRL